MPNTQLKMYVEVLTGREDMLEYALTETECVKFFSWDGHKATDIPNSVFAAAPELLAACRAALVDLQDDELYQAHKEAIKTLQTAINKTEGNGEA